MSSPGGSQPTPESVPGAPTVAPQPSFPPGTGAPSVDGLPSASGGGGATTVDTNAMRVYADNLESLIKPEGTSQPALAYFADLMSNNQDPKLAVGGLPDLMAFNSGFVSTVAEPTKAALGATMFAISKLVDQVRAVASKYESAEEVAKLGSDDFNNFFAGVNTAVGSVNGGGSGSGSSAGGSAGVTPPSGSGSSPGAPSGPPAGAGATPAAAPGPGLSGGGPAKTNSR